MRYPRPGKSEDGTLKRQKRGWEVKPFHTEFGDVLRGPCLVPIMTHPGTATGRDAFRGLFIRGWVAFPYVYFYLHPACSAGAASLQLGA